MNKEIISFFEEIPPVYAESSKAFWDDEHISKSMLAAHLDAEHDGASRRLATIRDSVSWICGCCGDVKGRRLLDRGCGPGLYSERLCDKGFLVTGVDFSKRSIEYAKKHAKETDREIAYHYQNYLEMEYDGEFDIAVLIYYDYGVLPPGDRETLLAKVHRALKKGGVFILDVYNKPYLESFHEAQSISYEKTGFWSPEPYAVIQRNIIYGETDNTLERYLVMTEGTTETFNIWNQAYSKETFVAEISKQYFELKNIYDDICGKSFTGQSEGICGVFTKK